MALYLPAGAWPLPAMPQEDGRGGVGGADAVHPHMPAMPPGSAPPAPGRARRSAAGLAPPGAALGPRAASAPLVEDYQEAYRSLVAGLAGGGRSLVPPGHPLYSRVDSAVALRAENDRLRKEIADLRARRDARGGGSRDDMAGPAAQPTAASYP